MKLVGYIINYVLAAEVIKQKGFVKRSVYTKTEIIKNDKIGCSTEYLNFFKKTLMSRFKVNYDQIDVKCWENIDHQGVIHTKKLITIYV